MPLPSFEALTDGERFSALGPEDRQTVVNRYWDSYAAERPDIPPDFVDSQRETAKAYLGAKDAMADAAPVERRALELNSNDAVFRLRLGEKVAAGEIDRERVPALSAEYASRTKEARDKVAATRAFTSDPETIKATAPALDALGALDKLGGAFGSPTFASKVGGTVDSSREAYGKLRADTANRFGLTSEELDDVVRHQLDLQPEPVSQHCIDTLNILLSSAK